MLEPRRHVRLAQTMGIAQSAQFGTGEEARGGHAPSLVCKPPLCNFANSHLPLQCQKPEMKRHHEILPRGTRHADNSWSNWNRNAPPRGLVAGRKRIDAQHARGKLTARERLEILLDHGIASKNWICTSNIIASISAWRTQKVPGDGVVTGSGTVNGRLGVRLFSQDFTVFGGSLV